jgi:hypothetical protein
VSIAQCLHHSQCTDNPHSIMPPRSYHAVVTLGFQPAVLQGAFFDSCYGMRRMLGGLIECAIWHSYWTNMLYDERPFLLAFLLDWHARSLPNNARFTGQNLYSLLFMAKHSVWLIPFTASTPDALISFTPESFCDTRDSDGVHAFLRGTGNQLLRQLPPDEQSLYRDLERTFKAYLAHEYKALYEVLVIDNESDTASDEGADTTN